MFSPFEEKVAEILDKKLREADLDPAADNLSFEEIARIEELTKEAQDEARLIVE